MSKTIEISDLISVMKHRHLIEATKQYSDYVKDIGGKSIEEFVNEDYLKDKSLENVIVKSELSDNIQTLENVITEYLGDYIEIIPNAKDNYFVIGEASQNTFDEAISGLKYGIERYLKDNY